MGSTALALSVDIQADSQFIERNASTTIRWTSTDAAWCWSRGKWGASRPRQGSYDTGPLTDKTWFGIACSNGDKVVEDGVTVVVRESASLAVDIEALPQVIGRNESTTLRWSSTGANWCRSRGTWGADRPLQGSYDTGPLSEKTWFGIVCSDGEQQVSDGVTVVVRDATNDAVSLNLTADPQQIRVGETSTLNWSATGATWCNANGAWSGSRSLQGSEQTPALSESRTYGMTCGNGAGETAWSSLTVETMEVPVVHWQAPTENVDGSTLTDLAGYWFYWGWSSGSYPNRRRIWNASATQFRPDELAPGAYYVVITALNNDGDESAYSNEIRIEVP